MDYPPSNRPAADAAGNASTSDGAGGVALAAPLGLGQSEPVYWGLALSTWLKVGVLALLMALLYRFNLARLWSKTNPVTGVSENWQHSFIIPLIGLYYLYVWRDDLLRPK